MFSPLSVAYGTVVNKNEGRRQRNVNIIAMYVLLDIKKRMDKFSAFVFNGLLLVVSDITEMSTNLISHKHLKPPRLFIKILLICIK